MIIPFSGLLLNSDTPGNVQTFLANNGWEDVVPNAYQTDPIGFAIPAGNVTTLWACAPLGVSTAITVTLYKNGVATALTCVLNSGTPYSTASDTNPAHAVAFVAGDRFDILASGNAPFEGDVPVSGSISGNF
jgi:hypothetical protein